SYRTCSFITASDSHQYMVLGQTSYTRGIALARSSILDITDPRYYQQSLFDFRARNTSTNATFPNNQMDTAVGPNFGIRALTPDSITQLQTYSSLANYTYNLTLAATSQVLYNGGLGYWAYGLHGEPTGEWSMPAMRTTGTITVRGQELAVLPDQSFTWYDRQWTNTNTNTNTTAAPRNGTWFQLHVPGTDIKGSIWALDYSDSRQVRMATFRSANGDHRLLSFGYDYSTRSEDVWHSFVNNRTYPLAYTMDFGQHGRVTARSYRDDQLTYNVSAGLRAAYEGFATFNVSMFGVEATGYGLVEIV
ncbi:hypothetical protein BO71DRAFT_340431, partial [Aspergillus ellipticus CBS 707.79]